MKRFLFTAMFPVLLATFMSVNFASCGGDGEDEEFVPQTELVNTTNGTHTDSGSADGVTDYEIPETAEAGEAIDLGLPSGLRWANCNVGATKPWEYGTYYAWGETEEKTNYYWSTYKHCNGSNNTMTKYCTNSKYGTVDNKTVLDPEDDVAHVKWGGGWRMPTKAEQDELRENCEWEWTTLNGIYGRKVIGPNGNSIFLPAAGYRDGAEAYNRGSHGDYWSSSLHGSDYAYGLCFNEGGYDWYNGRRRYCGLSVRPVCP